MTTNADRARALRERARYHPGQSQHRRALLVAAVLLDTTRTITGAQRQLRTARLPDDLRDRADAVLTQLAATNQRQPTTKEVTANERR